MIILYSVLLLYLNVKLCSVLLLSVLLQPIFNIIRRDIYNYSSTSTSTLA